MGRGPDKRICAAGSQLGVHLKSSFEMLRGGNLQRRMSHARAMYRREWERGIKESASNLQAQYSKARVDRFWGLHCSIAVTRYGLRNEGEIRTSNDYTRMH